MTKSITITQFIPANALESSVNTYPYARLEDKIRTSLVRFLVNKSFTDGPIPPNSIRLHIIKKKFSIEKMGYDVEARIL